MGWNSFFRRISVLQSRPGAAELALAVILAGLEEAYGLYRIGEDRSSAFDYLSLLCFATLTVGLSYLFVLRMAGRHAPAWGWIRFAVGTLALLMPAALGVALALWFGRGTSGAIASLLIGLFLSAAAVSILPGWPVAMLFGGWRAGLLQVFNASHGSRWAIIGASFVTYGVSRSAPDLEKATTLTARLLYASLDLALTLFQLFWLPAIAVAAWQVAAANDPRLCDEPELD